MKNTKINYISCHDTVMERYIQGVKTVEMEFGDKTNEYNIGDQVVFWAGGTSQAVSATISGISKKSINSLGYDDAGKLGAKGINELEGFVNRNRRNHKEVTMLELSDIKTIEKPMAEIQAAIGKGSGRRH